MIGLFISALLCLVKLFVVFILLPLANKVVERDPHANLRHLVLLSLINVSICVYTY